MREIHIQYTAYIHVTPKTLFTLYYSSVSLFASTKQESLFAFKLFMDIFPFI